MKWKYSTLLALILVAFSGRSQNVINLGHLNSTSVNFPHLSHVHKGECTHRGPCKTMALLDRRLSSEEGSPESRNRPQFQGTELLATLDHFVFHYSLDGPADERIDPTDSDQNGFPDYLEFMAFTFKEIADDYHQNRDYPYPPHDGSEIDEAYYDVYIANHIAGEGVYGFVQPEETIGDNPSTSLEESESTTSFMAMRSNYEGFGPNQAFSIKVTAAHEYVHAVQFAYWLDMDRWLFEGSAAMMEEYKYPGLDDNFQYLDGIFKNPDAPFNLDRNEIPQLGNHWYSTWSFWQYLIEQTDIDFLKEVFEEGIDYYAFGAIDQVLQAQGGNVENAFISYFIANALLTDDEEAGPFRYERAADYKRTVQGVKLESNYEFDGVQIYHNSEQDGNGFLMRTSCDYHYFTSDQDFRVEAAYQSGADEVKFFVVKVDGVQSIVHGVGVQQLQWDGTNFSTQIEDSWNWDHYYLLCIRTNFSSRDLNSLQYEFVINPAMNTSVSDHSDRYDIEVFPNITDDYFQIELNDFEGSITSYIVHPDGRRSELGAQLTHSLSVYPSGLYQLVVMDGADNIVHREKMIKL